MWDISATIKGMARAPSSGKMEGCTMERGKMGSSMEEGSSLRRTGRSESESGKMEEKSDGFHEFQSAYIYFNPYIM